VTPGVVPFTSRTPRVIAARKLHRRRERDAARLFLAEGPQAVRSALAAGAVRELFGTASALPEFPSASLVDDGGLAALAETPHPQGIVAVCPYLDVPLSTVVAARLVAVLVDVGDPGNAGTVLRTADAAGAGAVVFAGDAVDPYNGKCVRASAGSLFHVDVVRGADPLSAVDALRSAGLRVLAATPRGESDLFDLDGLDQPTAWVFGSEAHGLPSAVLEAADARVRIPIYGGAESLNLAAAAAVCLYSSARALSKESS
jgi:TrmH family RNA methyltransferase